MDTMKLKVVLAALLLTVSLNFIACNPFMVAAQSTLAVRKAGDAIDKGLAEATDKKTKECLDKHGTGTVGYANCVNTWRKDMKIWREIVAPSISAAVTTSYFGIKIAKEAKAEPKEIMPKILDAACLVVTALKQFEHMLPANVRAAVSSTLAVVKGLVCK